MVGTETKDLKIVLLKNRRPAQPSGFPRLNSFLQQELDFIMKRESELNKASTIYFTQHFSVFLTIWLTTLNPQEKSTWRSDVRSALRAASQLPGREPTDVDDAPAH